MANNKAKWIEKLATMQRLVDDPRTPEGEREAAARKMEELMIRWGIEDAEIAHANGKEVKGAIITREVIVEGIYASEIGHIGHAIAMGLNIASFRRKYTKSREGVVFCGHTEDVDRAEILFTSLRTQSDTAVIRWNKDQVKTAMWPKMTAMQKYKMRRSFIIGIADVIGSRLIAMRATVVESISESTALAVRDRRSEVDAYMAENFQLKASGRGKQMSGSAMADGRNAGSTMDLGQTRVTNSNNAAGSIAS